MNWLKKTLVGAAVAVSMAGAVQATPINVGGVIWDPDAPTDFSSFSVAIRQFVDPGTGVVSGWGHIFSINGTGQGVFCPGCELTFQFGGFTPIGGTILPTTPGISIDYTGGFVKVYVDNSPEITDPSDPYSLTFGNTGDGALWLDLVGHDLLGTGISFTGDVNGNVITGNISSLTGSGLLDIIGGLAAGNLNTDSQFDNADITFTNSFTLFTPGTTRPFDSAGTGNFFGNSIPEPGSLALLGLALLGVGALGRRKLS